MALQIKWRSAEVNFQVEMEHSYPAALDDPKLSDVSFLGYVHRHLLYFKVSIQLFHDDRDIEFIQFKRWCQSLYHNQILQANSKSCEMISDDLANMIHARYPSRELKIGVFEDGENGSVTHYKPE